MMDTLKASHVLRSSDLESSVQIYFHRYCICLLITL